MAFVYCEECGREISDKAKFCPQCGCTFKIKGRGFAITSMVLGIVACTFALPVVLSAINNALAMIDLGHFLTIFVSAFTVVLAVLTLVFALISKSLGCKLKKGCAGLILGITSTVISLACLIMNIIFAVAS